MAKSQENQTSDGAATATLEKPEKPKAEFRVPYVEVGMTVLWYRDGNRDDSPNSATIIACGIDGLLELSIQCRGGGVVARDGVRHVDDPRRRLIEGEEGDGAWEHSKVSQAIIDLADLK